MSQVLNLDKNVLLATLVLLSVFSSTSQGRIYKCYMRNDDAAETTFDFLFNNALQPKKSLPDENGNIFITYKTELLYGKLNFFLKIDNDRNVLYRFYAKKGDHKATFVKDVQADKRTMTAEALKFEGEEDLDTFDLENSLPRYMLFKIPNQREALCHRTFAKFTSKNKFDLIGYLAKLKFDEKEYEDVDDRILENDGKKKAKRTTKRFGNLVPNKYKIRFGTALIGPKKAPSKQASLTDSSQREQNVRPEVVVSTETDEEDPIVTDDQEGEELGVGDMSLIEEDSDRILV